MILKWSTVMIIFICCLIITSMLTMVIMSLPRDTKILCAPLMNNTKAAVGQLCVCRDDPFKYVVP